MLKLLILAIGGFVTLSSYGSDYYDNLYQECNKENKNYADYKESILNRKPLSGKILIKEFQKYASNPKHEVSNGEQVSNIISKIQKDLKAFTGNSKCHKKSS